MDLKCALMILLNIVYVSASSSKSTMRTLYKGPVEPPAPGKEFDILHWLKSAMPKREERCTGTSKQKPATCDLNELPDIVNTAAVGCGNGTAAPYGTNCTLKCTNGQVPSKDVHEACGPDDGATGLIEPSVATIMCRGEWLVYKHIGLEYEEIIPNSRFHESYDDGKYARLNLHNAWCSDWGSTNPWVEVDFMKSTLVSGIITQGHDDDVHRVLEYKVGYLAPTTAFEYVLNATGGVKLFTGNINDSNTPVIQLFPKSINAMKVQIVCTEFFTEIACLRFELLGHRLN